MFNVTFDVVLRFVTVAYCPGEVITIRLPGRVIVLLFPVTWISIGKVHNVTSAGNVRGF